MFCRYPGFINVIYPIGFVCQVIGCHYCAKHLIIFSGLMTSRDNDFVLDIANVYDLTIFKSGLRPINP